VASGLDDDGAEHSAGFVGAADVFVGPGDGEGLPVAFAGVDAAGIEGLCAFGESDVGGIFGGGLFVGDGVPKDGFVVPADGLAGLDGHGWGIEAVAVHNDDGGGVRANLGVVGGTADEQSEKKCGEGWEENDSHDGGLWRRRRVLPMGAG
jgi:hypothetical protein